MAKNSIKKRFAKDVGLPIPVFEEPYWSFFLNLYEKEYWAKSIWTDFQKGLQEEYDNNPDLFLTDYSKVRDTMIENIKSHPRYKDFNEGDMKRWDLGNLGIRKNNIYNHEFSGKTFISVDLKKANIQAMMRYNIITGEGYLDNIYHDWITIAIEGNKKLLSWYIPSSKYIRQAIFGNCNPKRQMTVERFLVYTAGRIVESELSQLGLQPVIVQLGNDEMVFEVTIPEDVTLTKDMFNFISDRIISEENIIVRVSPFKLIENDFISESEILLRTYEKMSLLDNSRILKGVPKPFHSQVYEILNDIPFPGGDEDLVFVTETEELAKFVHRLKLTHDFD